MSFRRRLLMVMLAVMVLVQLVTAFATLRTIQQDVLDKGGRELGVGLDVMQQLLAERGQQLRDNVAILADDFGFKSAVATQDSTTLASVLANHGDRAGADMALLTDTQGRLLASSHHEVGEPLPFPDLWQQAMDDNTAVQVVIQDTLPYQFVLLPVRAPGLIGWVGMGFLLDDTLTDEISALTRQQTSVFTLTDDSPDASLASSLPADDRGRLQALEDELRAGEYREATRFDPDQAYLTRAALLHEGGDGHVFAVAQVSRDELMAVYEELRWQLLVIFALTLLLTAMIAALSARSMGRPLGILAACARRIGQGERLKDIPVSRQGETGLLATTLLGMQDDIDRREQALLHQSLHDPLTELGNRYSAQQDIDVAIEASHPFTLLRLSILGFRAINDTFGYTAGDQALKVLAARLRELPPPAQASYRLGGDEFLIQLDAPRADTDWLIDLHEILVTPIDLEGSPIRLSLAMGEVHYPDHGDNATLLLRRAEIALDMASQAREPHQCYREGQDEQHLRELTLIRDLQDAARQGQLGMVYQPQLEAGSGRLSGVEALMRWEHPSLGFIPPDEFITLAERSGNIQGLTTWMLGTVCAQLSEWEAQGHPLVASVNLSAMDVTDAGLPERLTQCLAKHDLGPERLRLEITESAIMQDPELATHRLNQLRLAGMRISVDDFGTGYSSLAQLKRLPVQELKIDKSFILRLDESGDDEIIVRSTIELGHNLGLEIVAEGVETATSRALLEALGCEILQGYLISRPLAADLLIDWVRSHEATLMRSETP